MNLCHHGPFSIMRYRFVAVARDRLEFPAFAGSMLRGAFGHALRARSCMTGAPDCIGCPVRAQCRYPGLFEPTAEDALRTRFREIPPPYIIEPPRLGEHVVEPGEPWAFHLVLFGRALEDLPLVVEAMRDALANGIGASLGRSRLERVETAPHDPGRQPELVTDASMRELKPHDRHICPPYAAPSLLHQEITLLTPSRIKSHGKLCNERTLSLSAFLNALSRKVHLYLAAHANKELSRPTIPPAMELAEPSLDRVRWQRFSSRQRQAMRLDGLVGSFRLSKISSVWQDWLWLGQYTHVGKNTSFGLGHYVLGERKTADPADKQTQVPGRERSSRVNLLRALLRDQLKEVECAEKPSACPRCRNAPVADIFYGLPCRDEKLDREIEAGRIVLGGCCVADWYPVWQCTKCGCEIFRSKQ